MIYKLNNGSLTAKINSLGAELVSLQKNGTEHLWQGDPEFWHGQSPLLFPNCGRYWDNTFRHDGQEYQQKAHGFARTTEFTVVSHTDTEITLGIRSNNDTLVVYPFAFFLFVTYRLGSESIEVEWFVRNEGDNDMHFQIGAHPAFYLPDFNPDNTLRGYFAFDCDETPIYFEPLEKGCVDPSKPISLPVDEQRMMPITDRTFDCDTYVIESAGIRACTLCDTNRVPQITVQFNMPVLALWAPTLKRSDCPFVAIEPWTGSCDTIGYSGTLAERRHIQTLAPTAHFRTSYTIILH